VLIDYRVNAFPKTAIFDRRILITGGSGFVGRWMALNHFSLTNQVISLNRMQYESGCWQDQSYDYIIHLANVSPERVIKCARQNHAPILYASSGAVVVDAEPKEYTLGKIAHEEMLLNSGLDVKIARMFTFCGAYMANHYAVINYITDALRTRVINIRGRENVRRSYMYAADMAVWMWTILLEGKKNGIYNVGSEHAVTMRELAYEVQQHLGGIVTNEIVIAREERPYYVPNTELTRRELGLAEWTSFEDAIAKTIEYYREEYKNGCVQ
jgi:nucleoside-diphosphate-sugar epimerase